MRKKLLVLSLIAVLVLSLAACSGSEKNQYNGKNLEKVTVVLDYIPNTNHTGIYAAKALGYYEEAGLDVEIVEPTDGVTNTLIAAGKGDFGISFQEDVTYALTMEDPLPIKAIAAIIQHNTSGFGSYVGKNIKSPADFEGKTYSGWGSPAEAAILKTLMEKEGADFSKLNIIVADNMDYSMLKEDIDVRWIYWAWDGIAAERIGIDLNYMEIRDFDERLDYYTPVIVANTKTLKERPEMVKAFLAATSKGYTYAVKNPDDAAEILYEAVGTYDLDMLKESQAYLADKYMEDVEQWGIMKDSVWNRYTDFMVENGLIEKAIPADKCYTNEFLPEK